MIPNTAVLGIMRPIGGGDPISLKKPEAILGRRPTCDVRLDFENISGKHCQLRYVSGVWHVRDLHSTNGTTVNGHKISSEHGLMPDDELGVAGHYYHIDYDPIAPSSLLDANQILGEEMRDDAAAPRQRSLLELAGLESADDEHVARFSASKPAAKTAPDEPSKPSPRPKVVDEDKPSPAADNPAAPSSDSGFFDLIRDELGR